MSETPITAAQLRDLRSAEVRAKRESLIQRYAKGVKAHVIERARNGFLEEARFWIVQPVIARSFLLHVEGQFYPWNSRNIMTMNIPEYDVLLKRPIPAELLVEIAEVLGDWFPDADIQVVDSRLMLHNEFQQFLVFRWSA
jgi:hypothetical protein